MPSPVGHSLTGLLFYRLTVPPGKESSRPPVWAYIAAANAADVDIILGLLIGDPMRYHPTGIITSLGGALLFMLVIRLSTVGKPRSVQRQYSCLFFVIYALHVTLDFTNQNRHLPLLWPFTTTFYSTPFGILPNLTRDETSSLGFLASMFSLWNLQVVAMECLFHLPGVALVEAWRRRRANRLSPSG